MTDGCDIARSLYRAVRERDYESFRGLCAADIEWTQTEGLPSGGRYLGAASVIEQVFERFRGEWEAWRFEVEDCFEAGDRVVVLGSYSGRNRRTGKSLKAATAHDLDLAPDGPRGRTIRRFRQFADTKLIADAQA